jgi:hypothetical protein
MPEELLVYFTLKVVLEQLYQFLLGKSILVSVSVLTTTSLGRQKTGLLPPKKPQLLLAHQTVQEQMQVILCLNYLTDVKGSLYSGHALPGNCENLVRSG